MNIKILDSWLREYLETKAKPSEIKEALSLTSASVERLEKAGNDFVYDIEVTTNRVDLMSVLGIAKEAQASLTQRGIPAKFKPLTIKKFEGENQEKIDIKNNPKLVNRICAVILSVKIGKSPQLIKERLESSGIRSLNNLVDVTNYVMREVGHPAHVFDFDRITTKTIVVRESSKGEKIKTLDNKEHALHGGDIVADDGEGNILDLLGIMGLENSVVTDNTKKILLFIDNNNPHFMRSTSMNLGIRTEAAVLNEKGINPDLAYESLSRGIELYKEIADAKIISPLYDIYPNKVCVKKVSVSQERIEKILGVKISNEQIIDILTKLGFDVFKKERGLEVTVPPSRINDISLEEDIVEEVARIYGYDKLPSILPCEEKVKSYKYDNEFFFEKRVKDALKYWGFTETYTNSMVSEELFDGNTSEAVKIQNPLNSDLLYMRRTIVPSLLEVIKENKDYDKIKIFEMANVYLKKNNNLPNEEMTLAGLIKKPNASFYEIKGIIEQLLKDLGIEASFKKSQKSINGSSIFIKEEYLGEVEILEDSVVDFEINFEKIIKNATLSKKYKPIAKYPPIVEDLSIELDENIETQNIIENIKSQSILITGVSLLDKFQTSRTFHIIYQDPNKNLTNEEVSQVRKKIITSLEKDFGAKIK